MSNLDNGDISAREHVLIMEERVRGITERQNRHEDANRDEHNKLASAIEEVSKAVSGLNTTLSRWIGGAVVILFLGQVLVSVYIKQYNHEGARHETNRKLSHQSSQGTPETYPASRRVLPV